MSYGLASFGLTGFGEAVEAVASGSPDASGSGALAAIVFAAPSGSASATSTTNGSASGTPAQGSLTPPSGSASGSGSSATASGSTATLSLGAPTATASGTSAGVGTIVTRQLKLNTTTLLANISGWTVDVWNASTGAFVVRKTGLTTDGNGRLTFSDAAITAGGDYVYDPSHPTYGRRLKPVTAS